MDEPLPPPPSRRYLGALAVAAALVLAVGLFTRDRLLGDHAPAPTAPPSEAAALQQLSQAGQLRRTSQFVAQQVAAAGASVVYLPVLGAAGVRWGADSVLSTAAGAPVVVAPVPAADTGHPPAAVAPDSVRRDWVLVVGRRADGQLLSVTGMAGGRTPARCGGREVTEYLLDVPVADALAGAGVFDLDGRLVGLAVRCDGRVAAIPVGQIRPLLARAATADAGGPYGLTVEPLAGEGRAHLADYFADSVGLLVTAVRRGTPADQAGLRAGDVLVAVNGRPVAGDVTPQLLAARAPGDTLTVARRRGRAVATVRLTDRGDSAVAPPATLGLAFTAPPARGVAVTDVRPGSAGAAAGLRPGDRLLRVGDAEVASAAAADRLLAAAGARPTFVVFERDSVERGVLLRP